MADIMPRAPSRDMPAAGLDVAVEIIDDDAPAPAADVAMVAEDGEDAALPRGAKQLADGGIELALRYPVTLKYQLGAGGPIHEETFERFTFHRLLGADMRAIAAAEGDSRAIVSIAKSARIGAGLMHRLYDRMDAADVVACADVVQHFLGAGRKTGR
jgi:hypothetical protein